jgi:hypothetical protein
MAIVLERTETNWYSVNDLVLVIRPIDYAPYGIVPEGVKGLVVWVDDVTGDLEIEMERPIDCLRYFSNRLVITPGLDTTDVEQNIICIGKGGPWLPPVSLSLSA